MTEHDVRWMRAEVRPPWQFGDALFAEHGAQGRAASWKPSS